MVKIHKTMEKLKVGDRIILKIDYDFAEAGSCGTIMKILLVGIDVLFDKGQSIDDNYWWFVYNKKGYKKIKSNEEEKLSSESQSKKIKQALRKICLSGTVIKSEKIIDKVKQDIGTDYIFGDTILRALRQLRLDGDLDYTADKHTREYTFK